jgi:hypothetical protein
MDSNTIEQGNNVAPSADLPLASKDGGVWMIITILCLMVASITFAGVYSIAGESAKLAQQEVSATTYEDLAATAGLSCSGGVLLKQTVRKGPLLHKDLASLRDELQGRADAQASLRARSAIAGSTAGCD